MKCPICRKGKMEKKRVLLDRRRISLGRFEAEACNNCGEQIFDSKEAGKIEARIKELGLWGMEKTGV